jgi:hypothetical protein
VAPTNPDIIAVAWRHEGVILSEDGGSHWREVDGSPHVHSDLHAVVFDPSDESDRTFFIGGDGGLTVTRDRGSSFDSSLNHALATLQFQSYPARMAYGSFAASPFVTGLIAGGLQDNGNVSSLVQGGVTPWKRFAHVDDGQLTQVMWNGRYEFYFHDDSNMQSVRFDAAGNAQDHRWDLLDEAGQQELVSSLVVAAVRAPAWRNTSGQRMFAVGVRNTDVYGYFSADDGSGAYWLHLANFGVDAAPLASAGSFSGLPIYLGTVDGRIQRLDQTTNQADVLGTSFHRARGSGTVHRLLCVSDTEAFAAYNVGSQGYVLRFTGHVFEEIVGLPDKDQVFGLEAFADAEERLVLLVAADAKVYVTRDWGVTWLDASDGLPRRPHGGTSATFTNLTATTSCTSQVTGGPYGRHRRRSP